MTPAYGKTFRVLVLSCTVACAATLSGIVPALAEPTPAELTAQIDKAATELENVVEAYNKVNEELKQTRSSVNELNNRIKPIQDQVDIAHARIGAVAAAAYKGHTVSSMNVLLGSGSPASLVDQLMLLDQFAQGQTKEITAYNELKTQYDKEKAALDTAFGQQTAQEQELSSRKVKIQEDLSKLQAQRQKAGISAGNTVRVAAPNLPGTAGKVVAFAYTAANEGKPYIFAASGPNGYDCSGLTLAAWRSVGVSLPHSAALQFNSTARISREELQPGDLVFSSGLGHVALYVGNNQVIHAPQPGQNVTLASINQIGALYGYGRVRG